MNLACRMMAQLKIITISCLFLATICNCSNPDEVIDLPDLPYSPPFRHYSGYLDATNGRKLHYWFVESQNNPSKDPLLLWMNGGPGCSSLDGLLSEHGPFLVEDSGDKLYYNPMAWNKIANVLYLEAPAGVGFSYSGDKNYTYSDDDVSLDNYIALQNFYKKYPQFANNDFFITGESYGGIYVPTLAVRVLTGPAQIPLKGFAVGNGLSSYELNDNSIIFFFFYHGLIGTDLWESMVKACCNGIASRKSCNFHNPSSMECGKYMKTIPEMTDDINIYNLYQRCNHESSARSQRINKDMNHLFMKLRKQGIMKFKTRKVAGNSTSFKLDPPCVDTEILEKWLNKPRVRTSIHIPDSVQKWTVCSEEVGANYKRIYETMKPQYDLLLTKVRGLIYNGDVDMACNFLGDQWFAEDLNRKMLSVYKPWRHKDQVAGFYKEWDNLKFVTIKGAGHMSPRDKPSQALDVIAKFINGLSMS